ncbi:hypothetical protein YTPLAS72_05870 [Nitrospira sp.]|nr:hypothetical protein YTPLAS72_05870 [Nitrospira sp.]
MHALGLPNWCDDRTCAKPIAPDGVDGAEIARWHPQATGDREEQERLVESSGLDWTIVKPPRLTNSATRGRVQASASLRVGLLSKISRADLAAFIFDEIEAGHFVRQRIFVKGYRFA